MHTFCASFPPIVDANARVLILGSMPGVASLAASEYYAHKRNAFWPILFSLWGLPPKEAYSEKVAHALSHRIAIWDVAKTCYREASSDASIQDATMNDLEALFSDFPKIHTLFFNGRLSESLFMKHCGHMAGDRRLVPLPSTSPAYTVSFAKKAAAWQPVRQAAEAGG